MNRKYLLSVAVLLCLIACGKGGGEESARGEIIPDDGSVVPERARGKNQIHQLAGKVKSFIETNTANTGHNEYKFDVHGNQLEYYSENIDNLETGWKKIVFIYDSRYRLIKRTEYDKEIPDGNIVWEYEYDGSHGVYIPCRYTELNNSFLQPGITTVKLYDLNRPGTTPLVSKCKITDGQLVFDVTEGNYASFFSKYGTGFKKITVDCKGSYPVELKTYDASNHHKITMSLTQKNGFPEVYSFGNMEKMTYTNIKDILMPAKHEVYDSKGVVVSRTEYEYNDKGFMSGEKTLSGHEDRYVYVYDTHGNWTKKTKETKINSQWQQVEVRERKYEYWN